MRQEFTPNTPEQNGLVEHFFRSLKEECVWQHRFDSFQEAQRTIERGMDCTTAADLTRRSVSSLRGKSEKTNNASSWLDFEVQYSRTMTSPTRAQP